MNEIGQNSIRGTYSAQPTGFALGLALVSIFIPLPFFILAIVLLGFTIVEFRASPWRESRVPARPSPEPSLRSPPA